MKAPANKTSDPAISSMKRGQIPKYFAKLPETTNADQWDPITFRFQEDCYWLGKWQVETKHEFLINLARTDHTIPFISEEAANEVTELLFYARSWVLELEKLVASRETTPKFLALWGSFNNVVGRISTYWSLGPDKTDALTGSENSRKKTNKDHHRIWYSHAFLTLKEKHPGLVRKDLDDVVKKHILELLNSNFGAAEGFGRKWFICFFDGFLDREVSFLEEKSPRPQDEWHDLTVAFKDKKLSMKKMKQLVELYPVVIPSTNLT